MRYGNQPLSEVLNMTHKDMMAFAEAIGELIEEEHKTSNIPRER